MMITKEQIALIMKLSSKAPKQEPIESILSSVRTDTKETAVTPDPVGCMNPDTCKFCNPEPLTLEGDIRYLKAHIETKDRQLADANKRAEIYREAWADAERENARLREENERLSDRSAMWYGEAANHAEKVAELRKELADEKAYHERTKIVSGDRLQLITDMERHKARYQEEILELEKEVMLLRTIEGDQNAEILDLEGRMETVRVMLADAIGELKAD